MHRVLGHPLTAAGATSGRSLRNQPELSRLMLTKEEYEQVVALRAQGLTIKDTARLLGYHPATISKWIRAGGPPDARVAPSSASVLSPRWTRRISQLLAAEPRMFATQVHRVLAAEGFDGSYPSVVRHLRAVRGQRLRRGDRTTNLENVVEAEISSG